MIDTSSKRKKKKPKSANKAAVPKKLKNKGIEVQYTHAIRPVLQAELLQVQVQVKLD